jgi:hypothetical protein
MDEPLDGHTPPGINGPCPNNTAACTARPSSHREALLERLFAGELMKRLWLRGAWRLEVLTPRVDDAAMTWCSKPMGRAPRPAQGVARGIDHPCEGGVQSGDSAVPRPTAPPRLRAGEIMELSGQEAADVLEITPALFRKRLPHAPDAVPRAARG